MTTETVRYRQEPARDRQLLAAAYLPVIAFAAVLLAARISRSRRRVSPG
jgi:hypothetical protein